MPCCCREEKRRGLSRVTRTFSSALLALLCVLDIVFTLEVIVFITASKSCCTEYKEGPGQEEGGSKKRRVNSENELELLN